ncbi:MAG: BlaI/MecI/CopY family transcriptional regulator [Gemmatimonadetes bacterium]|nr:BlaI/MecI/CopY family transcriptional regulator [Gemmatimonadota bacterium]
MVKELQHELSRRERQIMDVLFRRGRASVAEVQEDLPNAPSYSAVRAHLRILEEKGHVRHRQDGPRYVYRAVVAKDKAKRSALRHLVDTFFNGSAEQAMAALLDDDASNLSEADLDRLSQLIEIARDRDSGGPEENDR